MGQSIFVYNNPALKSRRQILRKNQTDAEKKVWSILRGKQLSGFKFFRQCSVGPYILDFYCPKLRLAIEIDGSQHNETSGQAHDERRTKYLVNQGIKVIRFWNNEILTNPEGVFEEIIKRIDLQK